jgi:hypothetical protein
MPRGDGGTGRTPSGGASMPGDAEPRGPVKQAAGEAMVNPAPRRIVARRHRRVALRRVSRHPSPSPGDVANGPEGTFAYITGGRPVNPLDDGGPPRAISLPRAGHVYGLLLVTDRVSSRCLISSSSRSSSSSGHQRALSPASSVTSGPVTSSPVTSSPVTMCPNDVQRRYFGFGPLLTASLGSPGRAVSSGPARAY